MSEAKSNSDMSDFISKMWNPFGFPNPLAPGIGEGLNPFSSLMPANSLSPAMLMAALDPKELQRKIDDLKVIENWLSTSLAMLKTSITTMELQKTSIESLRSSHDTMNAMAKVASDSIAAAAAMPGSDEKVAPSARPRRKAAPASKR